MKTFGTLLPAYSVGLKNKEQVLRGTDCFGIVERVFVFFFFFWGNKDCFLFQTRKLGFLFSVRNFASTVTITLSFFINKITS